jgi:HlyD family secretion protein
VGYSADVEIVTERRDQATRIPTSALLPNKRVLVMGANGVLEERSVGTGVSNWEFTEVTTGLSAGEKVVTSLERAGVRAGERAVAEAKPAAPRQ